MFSFKGWLGETLLRLGMFCFIDHRIYRRVHNIMVPAADGTTQIDHVLISNFGIFVVETKNFRGWIFGSEKDERWCQVIYGKKSFFQNPLRQNYRHTRCLSEFLGLDHALFHSVVIFVGDCTFKTPMPENVLQTGLGNYLRRFTVPVLTIEQVQEVEVKLKRLKTEAQISNRQHVHSLAVRYSSTNCPRCGGSLVSRVAKRGSRAGQSFFGCSSYPKCRFTKAQV